MFLNLLAAAAESMIDKKISIGEAAVDALVGFIVVFLGIALLVFIVWIVGQIMQKVNPTGKASSSKKEAKNETKPKNADSVAVKPSVSADGIDEETIAVISAAIAAYYSASNQANCGFVVKRIKRM